MTTKAEKKQEEIKDVKKETNAKGCKPSSSCKEKKA
jgi:hypothetical protein